MPFAKSVPVYVAVVKPVVGLGLETVAKKLGYLELVAGASQCRHHTRVRLPSG
jgi:hypothetical protein